MISVVQNLLQHLEQVLQAVDVAMVVDLAREDVGKVDHPDLHLGQLLYSGVQLVGVGLREEAVPSAVVLRAGVVALHAGFLVQGVHCGEALLDVVVVLQNPIVLLQAPGAGFVLLC